MNNHGKVSGKKKHNIIRRKFATGVKVELDLVTKGSKDSIFSLPIIIISPLLYYRESKSTKNIPSLPLFSPRLSDNISIATDGPHLNAHRVM